MDWGLEWISVTKRVRKVINYFQQSWLVITDRRKIRWPMKDVKIFRKNPN